MRPTRPILLAAALFLNLPLPGAGSQAPVQDVAHDPGLSVAATTGLCFPTTGCAAPAPQEQEAGLASEGLDLVSRATLQTPGWNAALAPLDGTEPGALLRVHGFGDVGANGPDGEILWSRGSRSFFSDWGLSPTQIVPLVLLGSSPENPFALASERPFGTGDLTGDGVTDVAVAHFLETAAVDEMGVKEQRYLSAVTVLDGTDGATRWFRLFPGYVTQVVAMGRTLLIGNETGDVRITGGAAGVAGSIGEDGSRSALHAVRFEGELDALTARDAWSRSTGTGWARWLAMEPAGDRVAAAWTAKAVGAAGTAGQVLAIDPADGAVAWTAGAGGYPRTLRYDPGRGAVVVHEQADPGATLPETAHALIARRVSDGTVVSSLQRPGATLYRLAVADVAGDGASEWIMTELVRTVTPPSAVPQPSLAMRVSATDPTTAATLWAHEARAGEEFVAQRAAGVAGLPLPYGLAVAATPGGSRVVVGWTVDTGEGLMAIDGDTGAKLWGHVGDVAFPLFLITAVLEGKPVAVAATERQVIRAYSLASGMLVREAPLLGTLHAIDDADVDGDGRQDLIVGGESGAVYALDGVGLDDDPDVLWRVDLGAPVHRIEVADVTGGPAPEVLVAAEDALEVRGLSDGAPLYRVAAGVSDLVWTFVLGDLDGDARADILLPTRRLTAYRGSDGAPLWSFDPLGPATSLEIPSGARVTTRASTPALTPDGIVAVQFLVDTPDLLASRHHRVAVGLDARTGERRWALPQAGYQSIARLWRSVVAGPPTADGQGTQVAMAWDVQNTPTAARRIRVDVLDSRTGAVIYANPLATNTVHQGLAFIPGYGMLDYNRSNIARLSPAGAAEVNFGVTTDIAMADFGSSGRWFLDAYRTVEAYPPDAPLGAHESTATYVDRWGDLDTGALHVTDLEGDGVDEVVAMTFDWAGYAAVSAFSDTGVSYPEIVFRGLGILEGRVP